MKLSYKIVFIFMSVLLVTIIAMAVPFYYISESFYKNHVIQEVENRLSAHSNVFLDHPSETTVHHIVEMENQEKVNFILYDEQLKPVAQTDNITPQLREEYSRWVTEHVLEMEAGTFEGRTGLVEMEGQAHIAHIWSMYPVTDDEGVLGYMFIDQDTGEFNEPRVNLLILLLVMCFFVFILGFLAFLFLSKRLTQPLVEMGEMTHQIASGKYNVILDTKGEGEVKDLENDIQSMADQLQRYSQSRREFLSHISHDLRTPITYIKAYSSIMKDETGISKEWREYLEVISQQSNRLEGLVQDLFQLSRLEEGKVEIEKEMTEIKPWLSELLIQYKRTFNEKDITCSLKADHQNIKVSIDPKKFHQIVVNLLENSLRYTEAGGKISFLLYEKGKEVSLIISDTGKGIPEEDLPHVWERFYRVDKSRSSENGGSGLGLAIVKKLVDLHGGEISISSTKGKGTTFTITLPKEG
ncbi:HAMP domain-containing sensor histidine kinase [Bacillus sp. FJAT-44742]|uniref:HAMP domain-containing sensor histidine kinase n=1 Tax=Bacillus sp. FJAT-44742 TaxID=2014005 RepID=UPI000C24FC52|nr:HAMP domain-containing sensor histidine kinase [Bacillus sp. FJAT-44742]